MWYSDYVLPVCVQLRHCLMSRFSAVCPQLAFDDVINSSSSCRQMSVYVLTARRHHCVVYSERTIFPSFPTFPLHIISIIDSRKNGVNKSRRGRPRDTVIPSMTSSSDNDVIAPELILIVVALIHSVHA